MTGIPHLLVHEQDDNVGVVVVEDWNLGQMLCCIADNSTFELEAMADVPMGHKVALDDLKDTATKYGDIEKFISKFKKGGHVHVYNLKLNAGKEKKHGIKIFKWTFMGYRRDNGRAGVRNHVLILPVDDISNAAVEAVGNNIKGTLAVPHAYGRLQFGRLDVFRTMIGTGSNPNVFACI